MNSIEHVCSSQNKLGEGPLWHEQEQTLYWVDIAQNYIECFMVFSGVRKTFKMSTPVTALGVRAIGGFVVAAAKGFARWDGKSDVLEWITPVETEHPNNRFNDGAVDPGGRFWAGTMYDGPKTKTPTAGKLYRLDAGGGVQMMATGLTISNGIGWSPDYRTMYLTDTLRRIIYAYEYDLSQGTIANRCIFVDLTDEDGFPDGLAVDREGYVWSARWGGWKVVRYDPEGRAEREVRLPVEYPTSCAFGGPNLDELYITSAWIALSEEARLKQPLAGDLFRLHLPIQGRSANKFLG